MILNENKKKSLASKITEDFLDGVIVLMPLVITVFVVMWILDLTESTVGKYIPINFPGIGLITIIFTIWLVGFLTGNSLAQKIISIGEWFLNKIPVVKFIYSSVKQFSQAVFDSDSSFQKCRACALSPVTCTWLFNGHSCACSRKVGRRLCLRFRPLELKYDFRNKFICKKI